MRTESSVRADSTSCSSSTEDQRTALRGEAHRTELDTSAVGALGRMSTAAPDALFLSYFGHQLPSADANWPTASETDCGHCPQRIELALSTRCGLCTAREADIEVNNHCRYRKNSGGSTDRSGRALLRA